MTSILTNNGAIVALQTLKTVNTNLTKAQSEISTGLRVASAKDNSSAWAIASTMNSDIQSLKTLGTSLTSSSAMVGTALDATEQVADLVKQIQEKVVQAQNGDADKAKLDVEIDALADTITSIAESAQYNGINLVNGGAGETITVGITRTAAGEVNGQTFNSGFTNLSTVATALKGINVTGATAADLEEFLNTVDTNLDTVNTAAATFGAAQARIEAQADFVTKQADSLTAGVSALVDADMEEASARLQALQTQQQLGIQALSIANQAPSAVLSLFQ